MFQLVNFSIRGSGSVDHPICAHLQRLYLQLLRLKNNGSLPAGCNAIHARRPACSRVNIAGIVRRNRPDVRGRCRIQCLECRRQLQATRAANRYARSRALGQFLKLRLFPGTRAFGKSGRDQHHDKKNEQSYMNQN